MVFLYRDNTPGCAGLQPDRPIHPLDAMGRAAWSGYTGSTAPFERTKGESTNVLPQPESCVIIGQMARDTTLVRIFAFALH